MQQLQNTPAAASNTYKLTALLLIMTVFSGFVVLSLYDIDRKSLVFFGQDTDNQIFSVFCACIVLWCGYGIFRVYQPKAKPVTKPEEESTLFVFNQYGSRFGIKGKFVFTLFIVVILFIMVIGVNNILTGQTTPKTTSFTEALLLSLALISLCSLGVFACCKAAFYKYTVNIDPVLESITHSRSFLFWSKKTTFNFKSIQYVMPSTRKFVNKYLSVSTSYGGRHDKTYVSYIYIKPYNAKPILFLESTDWSKVQQKSQELSQLLGCGIHTPDFTNPLKGYW